MAKSVIKLIVDGDSRGARAALKDASNSADSTGSSLKKFGEVAAAAFAVAGAVAIDFAKHAVSAAEDEQAAHVRLLDALRNTKQSWQDESKVIEQVDKSSEQFGYTTADTESALAQLELATGNTSKALMLLTIAQNVAAGSGKPLADVLMGVIKLSEGNARVLKQMGIDIAVPAGGALKTAQALEAVAKAQQHVKDVQDSVNSQTETHTLANDQAVIAAKQRLLFLEQTIQTSKVRTLGQEQQLVIAQEAVRNAEAKASASGVAGAAALQKAQEALTTAQDKYNQVAHAGDNMVAALAKRYGGDASAQAQTFQGHVAALKAEWTDFEAKIGNRIIPAIDDLMKAISDPTNFAVAETVLKQWEKNLFTVIDNVDHAINFFIHAYNAVVDVSNLIPGLGGGKTLSTLPTNFANGVTVPQPSNAQTASPQADALRQIAYDRAHGITPSPSLLAAAGNADTMSTLSPAQLQHNRDVIKWLQAIANKPTVHIHAPSPSSLAASNVSHNKRNGLKAPNARYTATPSH